MTNFAAIDFETAIRLVVSLGGDSDTLACITGGLAEAYYQEIPEEIVKEMWSRLPETLREILQEMKGRFGCPLGDL
jgi:ADP-ribosylglycohydrolase